MHKYLPSKKIVVAIIILILIIFAVFGISNYSPSNTENTSNIVADNTVFGGADEDNDGLRDWEEALWGTNAQDPDTDGDGTTDGDEISQKRNPLIPGPDDILEEEIIADAVQENQNGAPLSETDELTREFIRQYVLLSQSGNADQATIDALAKEFSEKSLESVNLNKYRSSHMYTVTSNKETLKAYGNILFTALNKSTADGVTEMDIFKQIFEENKFDEIEKLDESVELYENIERELLLMQVPIIVSPYHLDLVNSFYAIGYAIEEIKSIESDPIRGLRGTTIYRENAEEVTSTLNTVVDLLVNQGVEFEKEDPGYQLFLVL